MKHSLLPDILLTPGPVGLRESVLSALSAPMLFHRSEAFQALFGRVVSALRWAFDAPPTHHVAVLSGSGSLANEAGLSSAFSPNDLILALANGEFGERLIRLLEVHGIPYVPLTFQWGQPLDLNLIDQYLADPKITAISLVAMETSTGMLNPVREIAERCHRSNRVLFVDAVSALGAEDISVQRDKINICTSVPNKGLEGAPGISFVIMDPGTVGRMKSSPSRSVYLDLSRYLAFASSSQTPSTPAVSLILALEKALDDLAHEGQLARRARYSRYSTLIRTEVENLGLINFLSDPSDRATAVSTFRLPPHVDVSQLLPYLAQHGVIAWQTRSAGSLVSPDLLQISVMGTVGLREVVYFLGLLRAFVRSHT